MKKTIVHEIPEEFMEEEWSKKTITLRKLTAGDEADLLDEASKVNRLNPSKPIVMQGKAGLMVILKSIEDAPWKVNDINEVRNLDMQFTKWLVEKIDSLNKLSEKKNLNSTMRLEDSEQKEKLP